MATVSIDLGSTYADDGASATDNIDGDISSSITTTITDSSGAVIAAVDTGTVDVYTITYTVSDAADNPAVAVIRTISVTADVTRFADLNNAVLPEVARAIADQTVGAITERIGQARNGTTRSVSPSPGSPH